MNNQQLLQQLCAVIAQRQQADPNDSYVASLHAKGLNKILEKVGEEAIETVLAARDSQQSGDTQPLVGEVADLWFHSLVMLAYFDLDADAILAELARRFDLSGLVEKANRR
ncbi:phosphoribosyl-ATP diphosphatase [Gammaproteobacteria bacterium LSUCC0057]|uniref:Phosphoribosyl-ATP pyrophosphatase n=1 Tax=Gammaproteobacteria bacterium LSUCC0057 TaxID=2559237 RepID=A0A4Y8ULA5_9GAMM|nr:phosphoribosyl-ATP diphosphatase [Gammaproteobacteria bacterium LSUCC0057]